MYFTVQNRNFFTLKFLFKNLFKIPLFTFSKLPLGYMHFSRTFQNLLLFSKIFSFDLFSYLNDKLCEFFEFLWIFFNNIGTTIAKNKLLFAYFYINYTSTSSIHRLAFLRFWKFTKKEVFFTPIFGNLRSSSELISTEISAGIWKTRKKDKKLSNFRRFWGHFINFKKWAKTSYKLGWSAFWM